MQLIAYGNSFQKYKPVKRKHASGLHHPYILSQSLHSHRISLQSFSGKERWLETNACFMKYFLRKYLLFYNKMLKIHQVSLNHDALHFHQSQTDMQKYASNIGLICLPHPCSCTRRQVLHVHI